MAVTKITSNQIGDSVVQTNHIEDGAITSAKLAQDITISNTLTVNSALTVKGDLNIEGNINSTTTTEQTLEIQDHEIVLNAGVTDPNPNGAMITVDRGSQSNVSIIWDETNNRWEIGNDLQLYNGDTPTRIRFAATSGNLSDYGGIIFTEQGQSGTAYDAQIYYSGDTTRGGDGAIIFTGTSTEGELAYINRLGKLWVKADIQLGSDGDINFNNKHYIGPNTQTTPTYDNSSLNFYTSGYYVFNSPSSISAYIQLNDSSNNNSYTFYHDDINVISSASNSDAAFIWYNNGMNKKLMTIESDADLKVENNLYVEGMLHSYIKGDLSVGTATHSERLYIYGGNVKIEGGDIFLSDATSEYAYQIKSCYNADSLWLISEWASRSKIVLASQFSWDYSCSIEYTPNTVGAQQGILKIGQLDKNDINYTHGITAFYTNGQERLRIDKDGNVGIGTVNPSYKLDVNGNINATAIYVNSNIVWHAGNFNPNDKADVGHTHTKSDITDFSHTHTMSDIVDLDSQVVSVNGKTGEVVLTASDVGASPTGHTHNISDVTELQTTLDSKVSKNGDTMTGPLTIQSDIPIIDFINTDGANDIRIHGDGGIFTVRDLTNTVDFLKADINSFTYKNNVVWHAGNFDPSSKLDTAADKYLINVSGSGNGTVTFSVNNSSNITWDASHTHTNDHAPGSDNQNVFAELIILDSNNSVTGTYTVQSQNDQIKLKEGNKISLSMSSNVVTIDYVEDIAIGTVTFTIGDSTSKTFTHNLNTTNYVVLLSASNPQRHIYYSNKTTTTVDICIDDAPYDEDIEISILVRKI